MMSVVKRPEVPVARHMEEFTRYVLNWPAKSIMWNNLGMAYDKTSTSASTQASASASRGPASTDRYAATHHSATPQRQHTSRLGGHPSCPRVLCHVRMPMWRCTAAAKKHQPQSPFTRKRYGLVLHGIQGTRRCTSRCCARSDPSTSTLATGSPRTTSQPCARPWRRLRTTQTSTRQVVGHGSVAKCTAAVDPCSRTRTRTV